MGYLTPFLKILEPLLCFEVVNIGISNFVHILITSSTREWMTISTIKGVWSVTWSFSGISGSHCCL